MKEGHALALSRVEKALEEANRAMGDKMGTQYQVDDSFGLQFVYLFKTKSEPDEAKLKTALGKLSGFKSVSVSKTGFSVVFGGDKQATLAEVKKASGLEIQDVYLAASRDGARYFCAMHPDKAWPAEVKCPECGMKMVKQAATQVSQKSAPSEKPAAKKDECDSCGSKDPADGCKKGCGKCRMKCGSCGKGGS